MDEGILASDGRGLVLFVGDSWLSWRHWTSVFDENGYDSIVVPTAAINDMVERQTRRVILIGHGAGARVTLRQRSDVACVVAISPLRGGLAGRSWGRAQRSAAVGPLLLVGGGHDGVATERTLRRYERRHRQSFPDAVTDHHVFPGHGHSLVVDSGWGEVAEYVLDWLTSQGL
ncbi:hypothetical protein acdb102_35800 [Acidothermaceae bacterium B102]|nr:hypothetical protein acdb102_35800 [Acidothermaceae bacterium B102]